MHILSKLWRMLHLYTGVNQNPYHNPRSLGKLMGAFYTYIIMQTSWPILSQKKSVRVCEILILKKKNVGGYQYDSSLHLYIQQKESTGWFILKTFISFKELFFLIMFFCNLSSHARFSLHVCDLLHVND